MRIAVLIRRRRCLPAVPVQRREALVQTRDRRSYAVVDVIGVFPVTRCFARGYPKACPSAQFHSEHFEEDIENERRVERERPARHATGTWVYTAASASSATS